MSLRPRPSFASPAARSEPFGFVCSQCSHCCRDKRIQVNPYEVARLARHLNLPTREFAQRHTEHGRGTHLARDDSGACVFLGGGGCTVHADRPLVCRLYPLGRRITADGAESFSHWPPHPLSGGRYHKDATIADYLDAQDAADFMRAADDYFWWYVRMRELLLTRSGSGAPGAAELPEPDASILDLDSAIAAHCARTGEQEPAEMEARRALHLAILEGQLP